MSITGRRVAGRLLRRRIPTGGAPVCFHACPASCVEWKGKDSRVVEFPSYDKVFDWDSLLREASNEVKWCKVSCNGDAMCNTNLSLTCGLGTYNTCRAKERLRTTFQRCRQ